MFEGKKMKLRSLKLTDLEVINIHWNTIALRRELGPVIPSSKNEIEDWIKKTWEKRKEGSEYTFAIEDIESNELIGYCSLKNIRKINRTGTVSIAIFNETNRGKGYGTDAMKVLLRIGFNFLNLHRIGLNVFETNKRAIKLYQNIGFKQVGLLRETDYVEGIYVNDLVMDILEDEWRELNQK